MLMWLQFAPVLLLALVATVLPGLPIAWMLRLRGMAFLAAAVAASFVVLAVAMIATPLIGIAWGPLPVVLTAAVVTAVLIPIRVLTGRGIAAREAPRLDLRRRVVSALPTAAALLLAFVLISWVIRIGIGAPDSFSQSYDNVFHLNAVAWILETGNASPFAMTMTTLGSPTYYPTLWHATAALVAQLSGCSVAVATNALTFAVVGWIWPVGMVFFARLVIGGGPLRTFAIAGMSTASSVFPYAALTWGVLYANTLATALLPIAIGFLLLGLRGGLPQRQPLPSVWIAFCGALGATVLAHPNAILGFGVFAIPMLIAFGYRTLRSGRRSEQRDRSSRTKLALQFGGTVVAIVCFAALWLWLSLQTTDNNRTYGYSPLSALDDVLTGAPMNLERAVGLAVLTLLGIVLLILRRRQWWIIAAYGFAVLLYVVAASTSGTVRDVLTGGWYNDAHRIAFLIPIAAVSLAAAAVAMLLEMLSAGLGRWVRQTGSSAARRLRPVALAVTLMLIIGSVQGQSLQSTQEYIRDLFGVDTGSEPGADPETDPGLVSNDELALFERLPETTPETALIAGDPWNGAAFAFAIGHRNVLFPHLQGSETPEMHQLATEFASLPAAEACELVTDLGVTHMIESSDRPYQNRTEDSDEFKGLHRLDRSPVLTRVDEEGGAALYEITGC
ncbi:MAG: DUF6541 family protein [Leucobacter sp.]